METMQATTLGNPLRASSRIPLIGAVILVLIGLACWVVQMVQGFDVLGVGQVISWGLYIAVFFLLASLGSGMLILAVSGDLGILPALKEQRRALLIASIACFIAAGFTILMDLGRPGRVFGMLLSPNFKSMFVYDFYCLALSVILALLCLFKGPGKALAWIAGLAAIAVVLVEGWILTASVGSPLWHNALIPVAFLVEALIAAFALALLANGPSRAGAALRGPLIALLPVSFVLILAELVAGSYFATSEAGQSFSLLASGNLAPLYWGQIILGIALPFVLLLAAGGSGALVRLAAILAILGVFFAKINLLVAGQARPFFGGEAAYAPSLVEIGGLLGGIGLAFLIFILAGMFLPTKERS